MSETVFFKHKYITNPALTPEDTIIAAANQMTETLRMHKALGMCEEDVQALARLNQSFQDTITNNTSVEIKTVEPPASPRVAASNNKHNIKQLLSEAITAVQRPAPRVVQTIFTLLKEPAPQPRVPNDPNQLIVAYP